jgi:hypothetical protein
VLVYGLPETDKRTGAAGAGGDQHHVGDDAAGGDRPTNTSLALPTSLTNTSLALGDSQNSD